MSAATCDMTHDAFRFGDCSLRLAARELLRDGRRVDLSPIVFDCIAYLVRHRERAVGRDELVAAVWGKANVSDAVMGKTILTARRAIGDTAEQQHFLRTVPRFGYQWVAPMQEDAAPAATHAGPGAVHATAATPLPAGAPASKPSAWRRFVPFFALAIALLVAALLAWRWRDLQGPQLPPAQEVGALPAELTIVLPVDVAAASADEWLRLGLMDLIATRLRAGGLAVLPSDNVVRLAPGGADREALLAAFAGVAERRRVVAAAVRHSGDWIVHVDVIEPDGRAHALEAQARDAMSAARLVADRILETSGRRVADAAARVVPGSEAELLQRVDAARLAGDPVQARALIEASDADLRERTEVRLRLAMIDLRIGEFEAARARLAALAEQVPAESDALQHARIQGYLCIALARVGRLEEGEHACDRAISLLETRNEPADLGRVYSDRGIIRMLLHRLDAAAQDFARARIALAVAGDALQLAKVDGNESTLDMQQGRYADAIAIQQRIGERFERFGMINEFVASLNNRTDAHLQLLESLDALRSSDRSFALLDRVTDASIRRFTRLQRADVLERNGRLGEARVLLDELMAEAGDEAQAPDRAVARALEAGMDLEAGQPAAALLLARQAIASLPVPPYGDERARAWLLAVRSLHALGRVDEGATELAAFAGAITAEDSPDARLFATIARAEQAVAEHRADAARALYEEALAAAQRRGVPAMLSETAGSYGRFLLGQGDLPQAASVIGLAARYAERDFASAVLQVQLYRALGRREAAEAAAAQARKLAGERAIPPDPSVSVPASAIRNSADIEPQQKRNRRGLVVPTGRG